MTACIVLGLLATPASSSATSSIPSSAGVALDTYYVLGSATEDVSQADELSSADSEWSVGGAIPPAASPCSYTRHRALAGAVRWYSRRLNEWYNKMGAGPVARSRSATTSGIATARLLGKSACPPYSALGGADTPSGVSGAQPAAGRVAGAECSHTRHRALAGAVRFYSARVRFWTHKMGGEVDRTVHARRPCPSWLAHVLRSKAHAARLAYGRWAELHVLHDFRVVPGANAWLRAVQEAQRPYPGTRSWLLSCSASEGGWGRFVFNSEGSGVYGPLQFQPGTFARMSGAARADVARRGFRVPASAASWDSALGQALAGAWGLVNGRRHEWFGAGCR